MVQPVGPSHADHAPAAQADARPGPGEALQWIARRWRRLMGIGLLGAALAPLAGLLVPPRFEATTSLFIDSRSIQPLGPQPGQGPGTDNNAEVSFVESQARIVTSRSVLQRVVAAEGLESDPDFGGGPPSAVALWVKSLLAPFGTTAPAHDPALVAEAALADDVTVRRPERTFILDIAVRDRSAARAARLANAVARAYLAQQEDAHADVARRANGELTGRLDALRDRLAAAQARVQAFKDQHDLVGTHLELSSEQQLTQANAALAQARDQRIRALAHLEDLATRPDGGPGDGTPEATLSPTIALLRGKQADARRQLASVLAQFGPRHPAVRDARDQLADADRSIQMELRRIRSAALVDYKRAVAAEAAAKAVVDRLSGQASGTGSALAQLARLQQEADIDKSLLDTILGRARETGEMERLDPVQARIVSVAEPPLRRIFPPRGIVLAVLGAAAGVWCASGWIVLDGLGLLAPLRPRRRAAPARPPARGASMGAR